MFSLGCLFGLSECVYDCSHGEAIIQMIRILHLNFAGSHIRIVELFGIFVLVSLHCKSFSGTCLAICKNSSMKPIHNFTNEPRNLQLLKNILLRMFFCEYFVKAIVLLCVVILLVDRDSVTILINV